MSKYSVSVGFLCIRTAAARRHRKIFVWRSVAGDSKFVQSIHSLLTFANGTESHFSFRYFRSRTHGKLRTTGRPANLSHSWLSTTRWWTATCSQTDIWYSTDFYDREQCLVLHAVLCLISHCISLCETLICKLLSVAAPSLLRRLIFVDGKSICEIAPISSLFPFLN